MEETPKPKYRKKEPKHDKSQTLIKGSQSRYSEPYPKKGELDAEDFDDMNFESPIIENEYLFNHSFN